MAWWKVALDLCRSCNRARAGIFCERDGGGLWDGEAECVKIAIRSIVPKTTPPTFASAAREQTRLSRKPDD